MALTRTIDDMESDVRYIADCGGASGIARHPQADIFNLLNRGIAELHRELNAIVPDQRELSSTSVSIMNGTSTYPLPADFFALLSIVLAANGSTYWMTSFNPNERAALTDPSAIFTGVPTKYRVEAGNIEFLPMPGGSYTATLYYTPNPSTLTTSQTLDTVIRLDSYPIWYAAKEVAKRDRLWDLHDRCTADMSKLLGDIAFVARTRDRNSPPRMTDTVRLDRYGRPR